ncbi:hypothetical protein [Erythrobacter sp. BLCC-B19]|uniref:hypothetical protein n=1 Tax=Erythrobacter sp. BLCC-B19 TaxID=3025315 RepID=UPI00235E1EFA|nr:hypothetical protein [Erythrobacter sp. BLCC-B19]WDA41159.1 hypothetical protein PS060_16660 [Erythrobacter sp. BLCC-B19]
MRALGLTAFALLAGCQGQPAGEAGASEAEIAPFSSATTADPTAAPAKASAKLACAADETPVFACKLKDGKRVAVCGVSEWHGRYRFGRDTAELELNGGSYAYTMYSGGGEGQIAFDNGDTRYIVFSRMVRTGFDENGNRPAISDGIVIERAGKFVDIKLCEDPDMIPLRNEAANAIWEDERELFTEETIRADPPGNE